MYFAFMAFLETLIQSDLHYTTEQLRVWGLAQGPSGGSLVLLGFKLNLPFSSPTS